MQCTINIYTQMKKSGLSMNKLIGKKEREQTKHRKKRFGLEMALAKLAAVRDTLSINNIGRRKKKLTKTEH